MALMGDLIDLDLLAQDNTKRTPKMTGTVPAA
jgi:hypothetical protein